MLRNQVSNYISDVIENMPENWVRLTTHRLDIYKENLAKTQFIDEFEILFKDNNASQEALNELPTAYDYIRLGHPLSCVLEWTLAKMHDLRPENVISFSSNTIPVMAVLRKNLLAQKSTHIFHTNELPDYFDADILKKVYGYQFEVHKINDINDIKNVDGSAVFISQNDDLKAADFTSNIDFYVKMHSKLGSILFVNDAQHESYISEIQHVRRRETIAMTPANCLTALQILTEKIGEATIEGNKDANKQKVVEAIQKVAKVDTKALVGSSGLSIQYAIMMGLIDDALENHPGKDIKFLVPPNCYGGTNDQARRVAACVENVEILDLPVDGENDMVSSLDRMLDEVAKQDAIAYIIAEIPTNPRVEVPDMEALQKTLEKERKTANGETAVDSVFILDQTFCPNVHVLDKGVVLSTMRAISYVSGSKFPSGGLCTAGYCIGNKKTEAVFDKIELHLSLCDNEATSLQYKILAAQMPSMIKRIEDAYKNTREFVDFIEDILPEAKINFVSHELADMGFTPSVFSLDLPTKGVTDEEKEMYKRALNHRLINLMITEIPEESKYCVSYGQLKGCYWTIPATSTQGTTKEGDKDYIARVALSGNMDLEKHKEIFKDFVAKI